MEIEEFKDGDTIAQIGCTSKYVLHSIVPGFYALYLLNGKFSGHIHTSVLKSSYILLERKGMDESEFQVWDDD